MQMKHPKDFIGKLETLATDIETLSNNNKFANFNLSSLVSGKKFNQNNQKTDTSLGYFQQLTFETIKKLYSLYESDFLIAGYEYPQNYIDAAKNSFFP